MFYLIGVVFACFGIWYVSSGYDEAFFIISGIISSILTAFLIFHLNLIKNDKSRNSPLMLIIYFAWLLKEIILSSLKLSLKILFNHSKLTENLNSIDLDSNMSELQKGVFANSITLTPGTITIDLVENKILVHSLEKESINELESMQKKVRNNV